MELPKDIAPDFYVVGAAKAGTTALYNWLRGHSDVFFPTVKEPGYFAYLDRPAAPARGPYDPHYVSKITTDSAAYASLYVDANGRLSGDASPVYLIDKNAASRIAAARADAKIIAILRDPVDRAFSQFLHHVRDCLEPCRTFKDALDAECSRMSNGWSWGHGYSSQGHYAPQIQRYLTAFQRSQILFLEFESLQLEPENCWRRICEHLDLKYRPMLENERVNETSSISTVCNRPRITRALRHPGLIQAMTKIIIPASLRKHLRQMLEGKGRAVPKLTHEIRNELASRYHHERRRIEMQTGLELEHWTSVRSLYENRKLASSKDMLDHTWL